MPLTIDGAGKLTSTSGNITTDINFTSPGDVLQIRFAQFRTGASHITTASTSDSTLADTCSITPLYANSVIQVRFWSSMSYGSANALNLMLYRKIGTGNYEAVVGVGGGSWATNGQPYYGWSYHTNTWNHLDVQHFDRPNTTQQVTYQLRYRNWDNTSTLYLVHCCQHYYSWILSEIGVP